MKDCWCYNGLQRPNKARSWCREIRAAGRWLPVFRCCTACRSSTITRRNCCCLCRCLRPIARPAGVCAAQRTAAAGVPQLGARRLLPHQRQSRRALHVVNYVTEHAPVAYKELTVGECPLGWLEPVVGYIKQPAPPRCAHSTHWAFLSSPHTHPLWLLLLLLQVSPRRLRTVRSALPSHLLLSRPFCSRASRRWWLSLGLEMLPSSL